MAQPASPFATSAAVIAINVPRNSKCILRAENVVSTSIYIKVNSEPDSTHADYYLEGGDAIEIKSDQDFTVNVLSIAGTAKVFWRIEPIGLWS